MNITRRNRVGLGPKGLVTVALLSLVGPTQTARAAGTWTRIANSPSGFANEVLLTDGTVLGFDGGSGCYRLTPDIHGSYVNGTWTHVASMIDTRLY